MLKITRIDGPDSTETFKLEGKLLEPWVAEVRRVCTSLGGRAGPTCLDLSGLTFVDQEGAKLLKDLIRRGFSVTACSGFVAELLHLQECVTLPDPQAGGSPPSLPSPQGWGRVGVGDLNSVLPEPETEAQLLERVRAGDEEASATLVRKYGGRMLAIARRFLGCEEDCADAVQDAFLAAFRSLDKFEGNSSLGTWLHRIVVNSCLTKLRTRSRNRTVSIDDLLPTFDETGHHGKPVRSWEGQPLALLTREETRIQVRACIDRLPEPYRTVLLLRDIEQLDTEQTSHHLGIATGAVKTRLHRARQALRTLLEPLVLEEAPA